MVQASKKVRNTLVDHMSPKCNGGYKMTPVFKLWRRHLCTQNKKTRIVTRLYIAALWWPSHHFSIFLLQYFLVAQIMWLYIGCFILLALFFSFPKFLLSKHDNSHFLLWTVSSIGFCTQRQESWHVYWATRVNKVRFHTHSQFLLIQSIDARVFQICTFFKIK